MKKINSYPRPSNPLIFALTSLLCFACQEENFDPVDIFSPETPAEDAVLIEGLCNNDFFVNPDRIEQAAEGLSIKGTIFNQDRLPITTGEFTATQDESGVLTSLSGFGVTLDPEGSELGQLLSFADQFGANVDFLSGQTILTTVRDDFPFDPTSCYFHLNIDPLGGFGFDESDGSDEPGGNFLGGMARMKNSLINISDVFIDPNDPAIVLAGSYHQFGNTPTKELGSAKKIGKFVSSRAPTFNINNMRIGLSASKNITFQPNNEIVDEFIGSGLFDFSELGQFQGFNPFSGHVYLAGRVPIKNVFVLDGELVFGGDFEQSTTYFASGFGQGGFSTGFNGSLFLGNDIFTFAAGTIGELANPEFDEDFQVELVEATLVMSNDIDDPRFQVMGSVDTNDILARLVGVDWQGFDYIQFAGAEGGAYLNFTENFSDWRFSLGGRVVINAPIPGLQGKDMTAAYVDLSAQGFGFLGTLGIPGLGGVRLTGSINYGTGDFRFTGRATTPELPLGVLTLSVGVMVDLTQDRIQFTGFAKACPVLGDCLEPEVTIEVDWERGAFKILTPLGDITLDGRGNVMSMAVPPNQADLIQREIRKMESAKIMKEPLP